MRGELRIRHFDREHAGQTLTGVIPGEVDLFALRDAAGLRIAVDRAGQRATEARHMGAAIALRDVVGEGQYVLVVAVVPPHRHFDADVVALSGDEDWLWHDRGLVTVEIFNKFLNAAVVVKLGPQRLNGAFVGQDDPHTGVQEGQFPQALFQRLKDIFAVRERVGRGHEADFGAGAVGVAQHFEVLGRETALKPCDMLFPLAPDAQFQPVRQRVHD